MVVGELRGCGLRQGGSEERPRVPGCVSVLTAAARSCTHCCAAAAPPPRRTTAPPHRPWVAGACVEVLPKFSPSEVWSRLQVCGGEVRAGLGRAGQQGAGCSCSQPCPSLTTHPRRPPHPPSALPGLQRPNDRVSVFMGVPTMYSYLLSRYDDMAPAQQQAAAAAARQVRERGGGRGLAVACIWRCLPIHSLPPLV